MSLEDFHAYLPTHNYIFVPTRETWPASSVNARIPPIPVIDKNGQPVLDDNGKPKQIPAAAWLDQQSSVEQMTWAPGQPMLIRDRLIADGGWIEQRRRDVLQSLPPADDRAAAMPTKAGPWIDHVRKVYGDDADHIIRWLAHRVQRPQEKINHATRAGRTAGHRQGHPARARKARGRTVELQRGVAAADARPLQWLPEIRYPARQRGARPRRRRPLPVLRPHEGLHGRAARRAARRREASARAQHPELLRRHHHQQPQDGRHLPAARRPPPLRRVVRTQQGRFRAAYWNTLWGWYDKGRDRHVAAYLAGLDLSAFDPKAPPPKTPAFWDIVDANRAPEDAELADVLDSLGNPDAITLARIANEARANSEPGFKTARIAAMIPHRLEKCGYVRVRNESAKDGQWKINGKRQNVYAKSSMSIRDRIVAVATWSTIPAGRSVGEVDDPLLRLFPPPQHQPSAFFADTRARGGGRK